MKIFICACAGIIIICVLAVVLSIICVDGPSNKPSNKPSTYDCFDNFQELNNQNDENNINNQNDINNQNNPNNQNDENDLNEPIMSYRYSVGDTVMDNELIQSGLTVDIHSKKTFHPDAIVPMGVATMMDYSRRFIDDQFDATHIPLVNYLHRC